MDLHLLSSCKHKFKRHTRMAGIVISIGIAAMFAVSYFPI
jgi:hypothetical protein